MHSSSSSIVQGCRTTVPEWMAERVARLNIILDQIQTAEKSIKVAERQRPSSLKMAAGEDSLAIKIAKGHGKFREWLETAFKDKCSSRTATDYIKLAKGRAVIEAHIAEIGSAADLSIRGALQLLRKPKKVETSNPGDNTWDPTSPSVAEVDPYAPEILKKLPEADRKRILADLGVTMVDVPPSIVAEIEQRAVRRERSSAQAQRKQEARLLEKVRFAMATNEAPMRQLKTVKAAVDAYDAKGTRTSDWRDRMDWEASRFTEANPKQNTGPVPTVLDPAHSLRNTEFFCRSRRETSTAFPTLAV